MDVKPRTIPRSIIWTCLRCRSTAFERSIRGLTGVRVFHEHYLGACYMGEEKLPFLEDVPPIPNLKYSDVKRTLEGELADYTGVFAKDFAFALRDRYEYLPDGFHHAFLIRNPKDSLSSLYRLTSGGEFPRWANGFPPDVVGFKEMWELYEYLKNVKKIDPIVIDADDVVNHPSSMMKKYCDSAGFTYTDDMLHWEYLSNYKSLKFDYEGLKWDIWYRKVLRSTGFVKPSGDTGENPSDVKSLPDYVQVAIRDAMPYYEQLYKLRMKP